MKNILVIGGGFAGMLAALNAAEQIDQHGGDLAVTLVSPSPFTTMRPRLYERDPERLRVPLLPILEPTGISFVEGFARRIDTGNRTVIVEGSDGRTSSHAYDQLILATGSELHKPPVPGLAQNSFNIDTYDAAVAFDKHLQKIAQTPNTTGHNTFVIVGAGMCGIELAAEMRNRIEIHSDAATAARARVILLERADVVGPEFGAGPRPIIEDALRQANVEVVLGTSVKLIEPEFITLSSGERIETATTIITTGMRASPLAEQVPVARDELGRLPVDDMLRVEGVPGIYATGDIARAVADEGHFALMSCQHSRTMGKYAGYNAACELLGLPLKRYRQPDYTSCLDLGNFGAVFTTGWERQVQHFGAEAKKRKRWINSERIYPPVGEKTAIFAEARIDPKTGR